MEGPPVRFDPTKALSLGRSLHELATNASKYGALSTIKGQVFLNWHFDRENRLHLRWAESGGQAIVEDRKQGFGSMLVEKLMARQLKADVMLRFPPTGAVFEFVSPLDKQKGAAQRCAPPPSSIQLRSWHFPSCQTTALARLPPTPT